MQLSEVGFGVETPVEGYGPGFFRVAGEAQYGNLLLSPKGLSIWDGDLAPLLALKDEVDVIFYGTGAEIAHAPAEMRNAVEGAGLGLEVMNTPAACRTYNVLLGEGRRVALAALCV